MAFPIQFDTFKDASGSAAYSPRFTPVTDGTILVQNVAQSVTVPEGSRYWVVAFSYSPGSLVYVRYTPPGSTPVAAAAFGGAFNGFATTLSALLPQMRMVDGGGNLSFLTPDLDGAVVGLELWSMDTIYRQGA